tara:strand:- start:980 stop:1258 length:279 start_codon:yes stop_codon:yes gene_type:complete
MAKLEENVSVMDLIINKTGSIDNLAQFIEDNGIESVDQNLLGFEIDPYNENNNFSNELKNKKRIVSTRDEASADLTVGGAFDSGFDIGFDTE